MPPRDDRGQSVQIGALLLFGFLVVALSGYQAVTVPQQNERVELNHLDRVNDDVVELRNDLLEAAATGRPRTVGVELGTSYPARAFGVNPGPPGGSLRTRSFGGGEYVLDAPGLNLEDVCGTSREGDSTHDVPSNALVYSPTYSEVQSPPDLVYENSVAYRAYPAADRLDSAQTLVDGRTISLAPLVSEFSASGSDTASLDFRASETGVGTTDAGSATLVVPTALDAGTWRTLLEDELQANGGQVTAVRNVPAGVEIELASAEYTVTCPVVGLGSAPDTNPSRVLGAGGGDINPADGGAVRLADAQRDPGDADRLVLTFRNSGETVNLSQTRFSFYFDNNGDGPSTVDLANYSAGTTFVDDLQKGGATEEPSTRLAFAGNDNTTTVRLDFDDGSFKPKDGDFAVLQFVYDDGDRSNYFVDVPAQSDTVGGGTPTPTPTPGAGPGSDLGSGSASGLSGTNSQPQTLSFALNDDLQNGEQVTIDLSDTDRNGNREIGYTNPSVTSGPGSVSLTGRTVTYTATGGETSGDTISVSVDADPGNNADQVASYTVTFTGPDSNAVSDTFSVA